MVELNTVDEYYFPDIFLKQDYQHYIDASSSVEKINEAFERREAIEQESLAQIRLKLVYQLESDETFNTAIPTQFNDWGNDRRKYPLRELVSKLKSPFTGSSLTLIRNLIVNINECIELYKNAQSWRKEDETLVENARLVASSLQKITIKIFTELEEIQTGLKRIQQTQVEAVEQLNRCTPHYVVSRNCDDAFRSALEKLRAASTVEQAGNKTQKIKDNFRSFLTFLNENFKSNDYPYYGINLEEALCHYKPLTIDDLLTPPVKEKLSLLKAILDAHRANLELLDDSSYFNQSVLSSSELDYPKVEEFLTDNSAKLINDYDKRDAGFIDEQDAHLIDGGDASFVDEQDAHLIDGRDASMQNGIADLKRILTLYLNKRQNYRESNGEKNIQEYLRPCFFPCQKSYTQKLAAVEALRQALNGEKVDLAPHLPTLRNGNLGKDLRQFIKQGKVNFLATNDVCITTIREFVAALDNKSSRMILKSSMNQLA